MDQKLLEDFLSLCRHRSFSHAAQERNVTQPAFSRRIRALEEELGYMRQSVDRLGGEIARQVSDTKKMAELYRMYLQRGDIL